MWRRMIALVFILTMFSGWVWGQSAGTTSFEFLKVQYSARGAAMANNLVAVEGDVNAIFYNPAVLASIEGGQWTINYVNHLLDFQAGQLAYARRLNRWGTVGVGLLYFNYGEFKETNEFGEETGRTFGASEFALAATLSNTLGEGFDYGLNLKFIYSALENYSASGVAVDAGLQYTVPGISNLRFGVSLSNLGFVLDHYTDVKEKLPLYLRVGFSKKLEHLPLLFTASLNDITLKTGDNIDILKRFSVGGEFDISEKVKFRIGYDNNVNQNVKPLEQRSFGGISAGLGILWRKFRLDYAFSSYGDLGSQNRLAVTGSF